MIDLETRYRARSLWLDQLAEPLAPRPALPGDATCDVAIVGAGFTGLWSAYYLKRAQPDLRVVVVEREIAGYGPSGRNGGWVSSGIAGSSELYGRRRGQDAVRRGLRETYATVDEIGDVVRRENIACGYLKAGMLTAATSEPNGGGCWMANVRGRSWAPVSRTCAYSPPRRLRSTRGWPAAWPRPTRRTPPGSIPAASCEDWHGPASSWA
jgi:glycine/D-amino acid oxidase-like deaminating enzyme